MDWWPSLNMGNLELSWQWHISQTRECLDLVDMSWPKGGETCLSYHWKLECLFIHRSIFLKLNQLLMATTSQAPNVWPWPLSPNQIDPRISDLLWSHLPTISSRFARTLVNLVNPRRMNYPIFLPINRVDSMKNNSFRNWRLGASTIELTVLYTTYEEESFQNWRFHHRIYMDLPYWEVS